MKKWILIGPVVALMAMHHTARACSPNLPNYGNCLRMQQEAQRQIQYQAHIQQQGQNQAYRYSIPARPVDLTAPVHMQDRAEIAVAFSPTTGATGVMSFAYRQSQTHYRFMANQKAFAHASCLSRALEQKLGSVDLKEAERFVKKHHPKSDCRVIKQTDSHHENLIAILKGRLPDGQYRLFMAARSSNIYGFSQEQPEFQSLLRQCQAVATHCEIVGQFGQTTELY